jgi:redox-regulated HSP33 family molecular chaperone
MVDENAIDLDVQKTVTVLAEIVNKHPASVPAMSCLGLLAFSGSMLGYKLVKEANAIPMGIQGINPHSI